MCVYIKLIFVLSKSDSWQWPVEMLLGIIHTALKFGLVLRESLRRGLELICVCLAFFPPSLRFLPYVQLHLMCPIDNRIMRFPQVEQLLSFSVSCF